MNISYTLWAYPYAYLVDVLLLFISALIGRAIIGKIKLPLFTQFVTYSLTGALSVTGFFALIQCGGITYLLPLVVLPIYFFFTGFYINGFNADRFYFKKKNIKDCILIVIPASFFVFIVVSFFFLPPSRDYVYLNNLDFEYYAYLAKKIYINHVESNRVEDTFIYKGARMPYHYPDIWLCKIVSSLSRLFSYFVYIMVIKVYFSCLIVLLMYSLSCNLIKNKIIAFVISTGTLFIGSTLFYTFSDNFLPWFLAIDYFPSIINYHGGLSAVTFLCLIFTIMWQEIPSYYYYAFMVCAGSLNVLLYPIIMGYLILNIGVKLIFDLRKESLNKILEPVIPLVVYGLFFFYTIKIASHNPANELSISNWSITHSLKVPFVIFCRSFLELMAPCIPVAGLLFLLYNNRNSRKEFVISIILFFLVMIGEYSFIYESIRGDIWQLKVIGELPILFFWGYFGIVSILKNIKLRIWTMLVLILMSVGFSMFVPVYFFGAGTVVGMVNTKHFIKIKKSDIGRIRNTLMTRGDGFAILKNDVQAPITTPTAIQLTEACGLENSIYRLNIVKSDTSISILKKYLKYYSIYNNNPIYLPQDSSKLLPLINKLNLQWAFISKNYYLPHCLKKIYSQEHNFGDFTIYTKD